MNSKRLDILRDRAEMLSRARQFLMDQGILEVDCPIITENASVDAHIDLIPVMYAGKQVRYMHSSPEYGMKRLLSEGIGDIFQISHVFRDGEYGSRHNPEFTMAEWYRVGIPFEQMIQETVDFIRLFLGDLPSSTLSYREVFKRYIGIDYVSLSEEDLFKVLKQKGVETYPGVENEGRDALLNLLLGNLAEPRLGDGELTVLAYYPSSQAALAKTRTIDGESVAERFEVYYKGVELANGYHELVDAVEQRTRLQEANVTRLGLGKRTLPIDESFLKALERGVPNSCGVAVGFDRLMMLRHHSNKLADVIPFDWGNA